jgi:hypothetical protein
MPWRMAPGHALFLFRPFRARSVVLGQLASPVATNNGPGDFPSAVAFIRNINSPQVVVHAMK